MVEKTEDGYDEDDEDEDSASPEDIDLDEIMKDLEPGRRKRGQKVAVTDPAWRKLERYLEEKRTREQLSDFDDYDIDEGS
ncbi:MAG: hypothetical protein ACO3Q7_05995 [Steroidobacteraceae bacterium]